MNKQRLEYVQKLREAEIKCAKHQSNTITKLYGLCSDIVSQLPEEEDEIWFLTKLNQIYDQELCNIAELINFYIDMGEEDIDEQ